VIGTLLKDRYRVDEKLGEGGMGVVYRAHDTLLDRPVAIKTLSPHLLGEEGLKRLLREAQSAAKLTHPNIVAVYDVIEDRDARVIVMEYVAGRTLREVIPLPWREAVEVVTQVCRALDYAHTQGVVHRDIKPENVVITPDGTAKVMDFGLARSEGRSRLTQTGMIVGTVAYMAPEQAVSGQADARSDLYSLGCVLYQMVTGKTPFEADDPISVISMHVNVPPVAPRFHNPEIPTTLESIVLRLLAKDPTERYASADELARILSTALAPVEASQAAPTIEAQLAGPSLLEMMARGRLVDREEELGALKGSLESMLSGRGHVVLVAGEPGIGKTRLAQELLVFARLRGCLASVGRCYEQEVTIPYLPVAEALRAMVREVAADRLGTLVAPYAAELVKLVPELSLRMRDLHPSPPLEPDQERLRLYENVTAFLGGAARTRPTVFLLDDLHWADAATLQLLRYLARNIRNDRILLVGTYRDVELDRTHPLSTALREMNRERLYTRVLVRRLTPEHVAEMIRSVFQSRQPVSNEFRDLIYRETEGNPFFVEEVLKHLVEVGTLYIVESRWERKEIHEIEVPQSVREVIGRRLERLSSQCVEVLTVAAAIGREFDFDVLQAAVAGNGQPSSGEADVGRLLDLLEEGLQSQLITEERTQEGVRYNFAHALVRETLYDGLSLRRKMLLHERIGEALERVYADTLDAHAADLAFHFSQVGRSQAEKAIRYALQAADAAARVYAYDEAIAHYRSAIELLPIEDLRRADITEKVGRALMAQGRWAESARALEEAFREYSDRGETAAVLRTSLDLSWAFRQVIEPDRAVKWAARAAEAARAAGDQGGLARASLRKADALWLKGEYAEAGAAAREAYEMAEAVGDQNAAVQARIRESNSQPPWEETDREELLAVVALADQGGFIGASVGGRWALATRDWMGGVDVEMTFRTNSEALEISKRAGYLFGAAWSLSNMASDEFERGEWARADALCAESVATFERIGASFGAHYPRIQTAQIQGLRGDHQGAERALRELLASVTAAGDAQGQRWCYLALADLDLAASQSDKALAVLEEGIASRGRPPGHSGPVFAFGVPRADALSQLGRVDEARALVDEALTLIEGGGNWRFAWVGRGVRGKILSMLGEWGEAERDFTFAADSLRASWRPLWLGRVLRDWGWALLQRGAEEAHTRGQALITEALTIFDQLGARLDAETTRSRLRQ